MEEIIMYTSGLETYSMPISDLIDLLVKKREEGFTTVNLDLMGEGAMGGGADGKISVS